MKLSIAGFNIDKSLIDQLDTPQASPESISAAYARISRSTKSVTELRKEALGEIVKARKSNENIIFEMGHSSIAEHAVFNLDIIGVSRLLTDIIQSIRLASFTEKSQRYVSLDADYLIPVELDNPAAAELRKSYQDLMHRLFEEYHKTFRILAAKYREELPSLPKREIEGKAKEDARYILPLATRTQMGVTINTRSLENLLRHLDKSPLAEAKELYDALYSQLHAIAPSLIRYTRHDGYCCTAKAMIPAPSEQISQDRLRLISHDPQAESKILAAMLWADSDLSFEDCLTWLHTQDSTTLESLWHRVFDGIKPWHKVSRAFEYADLSFELTMSESCWAQFKRHRMGSIAKRTCKAGCLIVIPPAIVEIGRSAIWQELHAQARELQNELGSISEALADYLRLNLDPVNTLCKMNLREIYHFVRLRSDEHAQWEIRELSDLLAASLTRLYPHACAYLSGKSSFAGQNKIKN